MKLRKVFAREASSTVRSTHPNRLPFAGVLARVDEPSDRAPRSTHPNRLPFAGVLARVDEPSDRAPRGARGHRVLVTRAAAEQALDSLIGMAVSYKAGWDGHDVRQKVGVITEAGFDGRKLVVRGYLFARDFPEMLDVLERRGDELGMSYEMVEAHCIDMRAETWVLNSVGAFTGAAILLRKHAAYERTSFGLAPEAETVNPLALAAMAGMEIRGVAERE